MKTLWGVRTSFSIGESIINPDDAVKRAKELGYERVAIADTMTVSAIIQATKKAKALGMEVIAGSTIKVRYQEDPEILFNVRVYANTQEAFKQLTIGLSTMQNVKRTRFIEFSQLVEMIASASFTVTLGDVDSAVSALNESKLSDCIDRLREACSASQSVLVAELIASESLYFERLNSDIEALAVKYDLPCILSSMPLYLSKEDAGARDIMVAIVNNQRLTSPARRILADVDHSMRSPEELLALVSAFAHRLAEDDAISDGISWRWSKMDISLPKMADDEFRALVDMCKASWSERVQKSVLGYKPDPADLRKYIDRMSMELGVLKRLGFCNYFLLVADLVRWSKSNGILVGPGRGSVGGSLVAFLIGITDVDPIRFDLLFERFINPERLDLPDADLDFMSMRRHEVIEYLREKYGRECVANISNYNSLGPTSAIGDVAKVYDLPMRDYAFKSYLPKEHGQDVSLEECEKTVTELQNYMILHPEPYDISKRLVGAIRTMGQHAAGVVVASEPIRNRAIVELRGQDDVVNWDKRVVEDQGLVKIDILGLTNLDVIHRILAKIKHDYGKTVDMLDIDLGDREVLDAFGRGDTTGIFQFESGGMRKLLKNLAAGGPIEFEHIFAANALYRPGPMDAGLLDDYVAIRQGLNQPSYEHDNMKRALEPTYGVIVYQEQVMQLAQDLAGFSGADADRLRSAMGKKDVAKMAAARDQWVKGCVDVSGVTEEWAGLLFDKIEKFAGYAFNKSHACEYSIISFWTMYLKINFPHAFYAAALEVLAEDKLPGIVADAAKHEIELLPPDINLSTDSFVRVGDHLITPFNRVKGIGTNTEIELLEVRERLGGKFDSIETLVKNVQGRKCNKRHVDILDRVGAFASIKPGDLPARHPDRMKDQIEYMPGLVKQAVRADRQIVIDDHIHGEISALYAELRSNGAVVLPRFGKSPKMAVILEAPSYHDERAGKLMENDMANFIREAMKANGLSLRDVYITTYLKKPKSGKSATNDEIQFSEPFFEREMELLKPPVIVALGSVVAKKFLPDLKGGIIDANGKVSYLKERDATVVLTVSPGQIWHDESKQTLMNEAFAIAGDLFN